MQIYARRSDLVEILKHLIWMFGWIIEHSRTDASLEVGALEHVIVDTRLATTPESRILSELLKRHRSVTQLIVDLENGRTAGDTEQFSLREQATAIGE